MLPRHSTSATRSLAGRRLHQHTDQRRQRQRNSRGHGQAQPVPQTSLRAAVVFVWHQMRRSNLPVYRPGNIAHATRAERIESRAAHRHINRSPDGTRHL